MNNRIIRKACLGLVFFLIQQFSVVAQQTQASKILDDFYNHPEYKLVAAHRGAHQNYPENSIPSIEEAIRLGVDIIELDIRETKDHHLVLMHDSTIDRTTTGKGKIKDLTWEELKKERLLFNGVPTNETVPSFKDALDAIKDKIVMDVDFKLERKRAFKKAYKIIQTKKCQDQVLFFISDRKKIKMGLELDSTIAILPRAHSYKQVRKMLKKESIKVVHIDFSFYKEDWTKDLTRKGYRIWANALGKYDNLQVKNQTGYTELNKKHINIIQTDYPKELLYFLKNKGLHR
ncbi:glycerophosphoryl diester phosphodiesterase [Wenyingzhuangia heitensis]|uniref:Glycerophosphoryl diester phosphodiesterase n=1 Tax=Wenyingzhuangia heitensis TaxID=1487859 RepID=A0ABX0UA63_9FLAO|nr:glycerophosphodiester phosphodiesterase family protein [Wenyingzhuangia heitensis]NIJ44366.1 glycerophosphoryl diester phosphodiesterase [Wenyingzhuangia heitensis]